MKGFYAVAIILTIVILCFCAERAGKSDRKIAVSVKRVLLVAVLTAIGNLFVVLSENEGVSLVAYSVFFVGIDWLLYSLLVFSVRYTGYELKGVWKKRMIQAVLVIDSVSMLLNTFFQHAFVCKQVLTKNGENFYRINAYLPYEMHLMISYLLVVATFICLVYKCYETPYFYRRKYLVVVLILLVIIIGDAAYVFFDRVIDASILLFAAAGISVFYYSVEYVPKGIVNSTLAMVVRSMADGVILFDVDGKCVYANDGAKKMLEIKASDWTKPEQAFAAWREKIDFQTQADFSSDYTDDRNGTEIHMKIKFHRLEDKKGKYIGCVFVIQDQTAEIADLSKKQYQATHDKLTGLYNEDYFYDEARRCLERNPDKTYLIICSNVKDFKMINDMFGTGMGDDLLKRIASELRRLTKPGEVYGRLGNDRFVLLMEKANYREERLLEEVTKTAHINADISYPVSIYMGVYEITDITMPLSIMCDRALMALGTVKKHFRKKIGYYDDSLRERLLRENELSADFAESLENGQFQIYLQPQVTVDGVVAGAEALVRWVHPQKGLIMPGEFIEVFEKNGMIAKLDQHVWKMACECLRKWKKAGKTEQYISINISPKDFYYIDVYKIITDLVEQYDIEPKNLRLEITETAIMMNFEKVLEVIGKLRNAGFVVEMDDFGSGYSSLNMLKDIPVDVLKVDMKFLGKTQDEERGRNILEMVVLLSKRLTIPVVIEGVETIEQVKFLKDIGCEVFQGYFFARPVAVSKFEETYL